MACIRKQLQVGLICLKQLEVGRFLPTIVAVLWFNFVFPLLWKMVVTTKWHFSYSGAYWKWMLLSGALCEHSRRQNPRGSKSCSRHKKPPGAYSLQAWKASNWLCCWMLEETAALVSNISIRRIPAFCCCESKSFWSKVYWAIWHLKLKAFTSAFLMLSKKHTWTASGSPYLVTWPIRKNC